MNLCAETECACIMGPRGYMVVTSPKGVPSLLVLQLLYMPYMHRRRCSYHQPCMFVIYLVISCCLWFIGTTVGVPDIIPIFSCVAVLVLFLLNQLDFGENTSTAIYHGFIVLCYLLPLFGAFISDSCLGKYG